MNTGRTMIVLCVATITLGCSFQGTSPVADHPVFGEANVFEIYDERAEDNETAWTLSAFKDDSKRLSYDLTYDEDNERIDFVWLDVGVEDHMAMGQSDPLGRGWLHFRQVWFGDIRESTNKDIYADLNNDGRFDVYQVTVDGSDEWETYVLVGMTYVPVAKHEIVTGEYVAYDGAGNVSHRFIDDVWVEATAKGEGTLER
jgi:hypothetical protein